jgi:chitinase
MRSFDFDAASRAFAASHSRRAALRALGGVAGIGLTARMARGGEAKQRQASSARPDSGKNEDMPSHQNRASRASNGRMLMGYYVGYERDLMPPDEIEWDALTHIAVGPVLPRANGSLDLGFDLDDPAGGPEFARDLAQRARANGVTAMLMIGGEGAHDGFKKAASRKRRKKFVANLVATLNDLGFDGLDLDWEPLNKSDKKPFKALVTALRAALPDVVLTMPVESTTLTFPAVPPVYTEVASLLDQFNIMTYGMEGPYPGWKSWHSSALDGATDETPSSVSATVADFLNAGVSKGKLGVGVGFFGDCWTAPVTGPSQGFGDATIAATDSDMSSITIAADYYTPAAAHVDPTAQVPYLSFASPRGDPQCTYITYEDAASIAAKGAWALDRGLNGAIVWTINQGHDRSAPPGQRDALLRAARAAFGA